MAGKYSVGIPADDIMYSGYSLKSAKDFARIGSQHGSKRIVIRKSDRAGYWVLVRVYENGKRTYPVVEEQLRHLTRGECPRKL